MNKTFRVITMGYLILLSLVLGAGLYAGIVVAPVTFHTDLYLGVDLLTRFQEGQIMSENFLRLSYLTNALVVAVVLMRVINTKSLNEILLHKWLPFLFLLRLYCFRNTISQILYLCKTKVKR